MPHPTDEELVRRVRGGDESAFAEICSRHGERLTRQVEARLSGGVLRKVGASDVVQEAYVVALQRIRAFEDRGDGSFRRWLQGIVERKLRETLRRHVGTARRNANREVSHAGPDPAGNRAAGDATPSQVAIAGEMARAAKAAIARLRPDYREVLLLLHEQRRSLDEAARTMGRTPGAVRKLYERALARLAEDLGLPNG